MTIGRPECHVWADRAAPKVFEYFVGPGRMEGRGKVLQLPPVLYRCAGAKRGYGG